MTNEYIKREDALKALEWTWAGKAAFDKLKAIPAEDVAPVVLCRNCQSYNKPRLGFCETHLVRVHGDDFCSYGKKREEG